ncbi:MULTISPECIES: carboxypeptidase-like regulatory domain-containing protein [Myxococcus]|uniref:carboxypeptidase-like regulatory domain-containing protein n=1 Tax=Myxococcus TaxID=32 RepID=UPI001142DB18|nr:MULTISPECIES: carboxypeptidase-like regulatory domain-containing protein [Myxococcus]NOK03819.1 carboxypeptidase regulatory-like domain-containing protein [Myxococcus xanthus]
MRKQPVVMVALGGFALVLAVALVHGQDNEGAGPPRSTAQRSASRRDVGEPTPPPRGNHSLRGRVLDPQRHPAAGIQLSATREMPSESLSARPCDTRAPGLPLSSSSCIGEPEELVRELVEVGHGDTPVVAQGATSADGTFLLEGLPEGTVALWAIGERHATLALDVRTGTQDVELVLETGHFLPGRVIAESGAPLPGARLTLFHQDHSRFFDAQAGADGRFAFGPLPPGAYSVVATHEGLLTDSLQNVDAAKLDPIVLHPPRRLSGRVLAQDKPVSGAEVHVPYTSSVTVTDDQGRFSFEPLSPGDYEVRAEHQGEHGFATVTLTEESGDADTTVRLGTLVYLEGTVRDESGRPIPQATVGAGAARGRSPPVDYVTTTADGRFRLGPLRLEPYIFNVMASGFLGLLHDAVAAPGHRLDFTLQSAHLVQGTVTDAQGNPVPGVDIDLDEETRTESETDLRSVDATTSDEHGRFELTFPEAGRYTLAFSNDDHLDEQVTVNAPDTALHVVLRGAGRVEGTVTSAQGVPLDRMMLSLVDNSDAPSSLETISDEEGRFIIVSVAPGTYTLKAGVDSSAIEHATPHTVTVRGTETVKTTLRLETGEPVSGIVVDELGRPVANATVDATSPSKRWKAVHPVLTTSDAEGRFVLHSLPEGECSLRVSKEGYKFEATEPRVPNMSPPSVLARSGARDVRLVLRSQGRIRGRVVRGDGSPITRFTINHDPFRDPEGAFMLSPRDEGELRLTFEAPGLTRAVRDVKVSAGEDLDLGQVRLEAGRNVRGRVVDAATSKPIEDAIVEVHLPGEGGALEEVTALAVDVSQPDGTFAFPLLEARPLDVLVQTNQGHPIMRHRIGTGDEALELQVYPGAQVDGTLKDRDGKPAEAIVQLVANDGDYSASVDEALGTFQARNVPAGTYTLSASMGQNAEGRSVAFLPQRVKVPPMGKVTFAFTEATGGGTMRLGVRMPPVKPDVGTYQALLSGTVPPTVSGRELRTRARFGDIRASTKSQEGVLVYEQLPAGAYTFIVLLEEEKPARFTVHREELFLAEGETLERDIQVTPRPLP